jgi:hypothetical protein
VIDTVHTKYLARTLEMLNFYSDTLIRLSLSNLKDVGQLAVSLISSILNYKVAVLLFKEENENHQRFSFKGLSQDVISAWNTEEGLVRHLYREIDSPTIVTCNRLAVNVSSSAKRLGLDETFLTVPLKAVIDYKEEHVGFAIAASPGNHYEPKLDIMTLDTIASVITGAIIMCKMKTGLEETIIELKKAQEEIAVLKGYLPICAICKQIRDEKGNWHQIEEYIRDHSEADFTHGLCPECAEKTFKDIGKLKIS